MSDRFRWLLDADICPMRSLTMDVVHVRSIARAPGVAGITQAVILSRALVTCNQGFRGSWRVPGSHPGIVIFASPPLDGPEVERNLFHLELRLQQYELSLDNNRFVLEGDHKVTRLTDDGREVDLDPWRLVTIAATSIART